MKQGKYCLLVCLIETRVMDSDVEKKCGDTGGEVRK